MDHKREDRTPPPLAREWVDKQPTTHWGNLLLCNVAPVWSTKASDSSFKKIQTAPNAALRTATGASIDHLLEESLTPKDRDHSDIPSALYVVNCLEKDHVCHGITT